MKKGSGRRGSQFAAKPILFNLWNLWLKKLLPAVAAEGAEGADVAIGDGAGVGVGGDGAGDAVFAQQVQGGVRRAVGVVPDVVRVAVGEPVVGVEARDLQHALEVQLGHQRVGGFEEVVVVEE